MYSNREELFKATVIVGEDTIEGIYDSSCGIVSYMTKNGKVLSVVHNIEIGHFDLKSPEVVPFGTHGDLSMHITLSPERHFRLEDMYPNWDDITILDIQHFYRTADSCARFALDPTRYNSLDESDNHDLVLARRMRAIGDFFNEQLAPDVAALLG